MRTLRGLERVGLIALLAIIGGAGCGPSPDSPAAPTISPPPATDGPTTGPSSPSASPGGSPSPTPGLSGRPFTVLVLGGDSHFLTDAIMVVGIDPDGPTLSVASIPRDTVNVPLPDGGILRNQKINTFYGSAAKDSRTYPQGPGRATADMVGTMLGIHIDYYAVTTFGGFQNLVKAMGNVTITLPQAVVDPYYQPAPGKHGVRFPAGTQALDPARALIFVRTRQGDNDFERQRRQQAFLIAAGRQLVAHPELFVSLLSAQANLITDFPLDQVPTLIGTVGSIDDSNIRQIVLGPKTYESAASCTCGYALEPKLDAMRKLARSFFPWAVTP
ncbi:MAG: LytR family transcriptional regulator [Chloroflexota bacterium]|nr:MAG: LytR family transcriptional regulator [Chloroflexota bacterium]